jgi:hypothetical protein
LKANVAHKKTSRAVVEDVLTREIRSAIAEDGRTCYALALASGVDEGAVRDFMSRKSLLRIDSAGKLALVLNLHLIRKGKPKVSRKADNDFGKFSPEDKMDSLG